jgi:chemotaxis protein methyltransferase CheR
MTREEFFRISVFVKRYCGIDLSQKQEIVQGRLENYIRAGGWKSYTEYMNAVENDFTGRLERELVNIMTTNHTYFMREFEHFEFLRQKVLPGLKQKERNRRDLCTWCAAASTGQEPYMLAMLMKDFFGLEAESWDTKILATDISTAALGSAVCGIYTEEQISALPETWKRRFLRQRAGKNEYVVSKEIKDEVIFRQFNLMDTFPFKRKMHIVFLRNVMIYFDRETKRQLIQKVYDVMEPGGYLFIGRTETIDRSETPFQLIQPSIFRKQEERHT